MKACINIFDHFKDDFVSFEYASKPISLTTEVKSMTDWQGGLGYIKNHTGAGLGKDKAILLSEAEFYINCEDIYNIKRTDLIKFNQETFTVIHVDKILYTNYITLYIKKIKK